MSVNFLIMTNSLESLGVQELSFQERREVEGGAIPLLLIAADAGFGLGFSVGIALGIALWY